MFNESIQACMIFDAHKPGTAGYQKAMKLMHTDARNTLFVGDQIFTDIWGANRAGIRTVLVKPRRNPDNLKTLSGKAGAAFLQKMAEKEPESQPGFREPGK